jgi:peptidoglycan hydrolase CwlO-like protein
MNKLSKINILYFLFIFLFLTFPLLGLADDNDKLRQELEEQIRQKQEEITNYQNNIKENQQKAKTLQNQIQILEDEISKMQVQISQIDLSIEKSNLDIRKIDEEIDNLEKKIEGKKSLLSEYLRTINHCDQQTLLELILKHENFSDFFEEINALENAQEEIQTVLKNIKGLKEESETKKGELEEELQEKNRLKSVQLLQKRTVENKQWEKEDLLDRTKGKEAQYQQLIQGTQKEISFIKEQLSLLEKYDLTIEQAVSNAIFAASKTGIRPAFLLGVLEVESRLGLNVGTGNWQEDMYQCYRSLGYITKAEQEKSAFLQICQSLGLNPNSQPVSAEPYYGCGGAMGIAQFMPTTWMAYKDRVTSVTGNNPPSPWNPRDAFTAAAIKLSDGGANQRTEIGERTAYAKYLAGGRYQKWIYNQVTDYVIEMAAKFQQQYFD